MYTNTMRSGDAISGKMAKCLITIEGRRLDFMVAIALEAKMEKTKVEVPILGRPSKGNKTVGWKGTGTATFHFNTSIVREYMAKYAATGQDFYFDIQVVNEDPTSKVGRQTILLLDCNIDSIILAKFDANDEYIEEELGFTFENWKLVESFTPMAGME